MGIFSTTKGICPKCNRLTIWDGPFSDCECYRPKIPKAKEVQLDEKVCAEAKQTMKNIKQRLMEKK